MNNVKYQYIRQEQYEHLGNKDLCITIGTEIYQSDKTSHVFWSVSFKNPKDKFNKKIAREVVEQNFKLHDFTSGELIYNRGEYTRHNIVTKVLMDLYINSVYLSDDYKKFIANLLYCVYVV